MTNMSIFQTDRLKTPAGQWLRMLNLLVMSGSLATFAFLLPASVERNLDSPWTSIRLAPSFALLQGIPLYSPQDSPPWVMVGYGPFYPLAYLPTTWAETPLVAVWVATVLAHLYILVPVALLCRLFCRTLWGNARVSDPAWSAMTLIFFLIASQVPSLRYVMTSVHVDAPALGLLLSGIYAILLAAEKSGRLTLLYCVGAGVMIGLSIGSKMNLIPAMFALVITAWWMLGIRHALVCFVAVVISLTGLYYWAVSNSQLDPVLLNIKVLGNFPWVTTSQDTHGAIHSGGLTDSLAEKLKMTVRIGRDFFQDYGVVSLAALLLLSLARAFPKWRGHYCPGSIFLCVLAFAFTLLPASIASFGKYGGDVNSLALFTMPVTLAALFAVAIALKQGPESMKWIVTGVHASLVLFFSPTILADLNRPKNNKVPIMVEAYEVVRSHSGDYYFPFDPLAHVLAETRFLPNIDTIYSYAMGGAPVDFNVFRSVMPQNMQYVVIATSAQTWGLSEIHRLLPEYQEIPGSIGVPGHSVLTRLKPGED